MRSNGELYEIRQCKDTNTNEMKAVKIYRKVELTENSLAMIKCEIDLLRKLDHPNIIKVHTVLEDEDRIYLVTDDIKGPNLFHHIILKNQLSESETASIAAQLASCVKYLHKWNVVIRRIKLESICFAEADSVSELRITDLLLFNYVDKIDEEPPFALEQAFHPPQSSFQGERRFVPEYCHLMSAPEMLPPINPLKDPRRYYN